MGSGPEVEEKSVKCKHCSSGELFPPSEDSWICNNCGKVNFNETEQLRSALNAVVAVYNELKEANEVLTEKLQQVNLAFAAHLLNSGQEEEPREGKRAL